MIRDYKTLHNLCCWAQSHCLMDTHYEDSHEVGGVTGHTEELYNSKEEVLQTISTAAVVMVLITLPTPLLATLNILFMLVLFSFLFLLYFLLKCAKKAHQVSCIIKDALESSRLRHAISYEDWTFREVVQFCLCQLLRYFLMYVLILIKRREKVNVLAAACTL